MTIEELRASIGEAREKIYDELYNDYEEINTETLILEVMLIVEKQSAIKALKEASN